MASINQSNNAPTEHDVFAVYSGTLTQNPILQQATGIITPVVGNTSGGYYQQNITPMSSSSYPIYYPPITNTPAKGVAILRAVFPPSLSGQQRYYSYRKGWRTWGA